MNMEAKIKELENNNEFTDKLASLDNLADVAKAFNEEGVEVTEEDLKKAEELYEANGGEITEEQLENVSGGGALVMIGLTAFGLYAVYRMGKGAAAGSRNRC